MKKNKGITLIALVITIIVLLLLAAISIATLTGKNGILTKANTAKIQTEVEEAKEQAKLDITNWVANKSQKGEDATITDKVIKEEILAGKNYVKEAKESSFISQKGEHEINYADLYKTSAENIPPIPEGFYHAGGTIEEGFVISDKQGDDLNNSRQGNQFVWVPVYDINNFKTICGYGDGSLDERGLDKFSEPYVNGYDGEETDYNKMKARVEEKGGFYIGRFEAGKDNNGNVVVKKGANVYNNVPWGNAMNDIDGTSNTNGRVGAVKLAKEFATKQGYTSVTSSLVYGAQWDATMLFMDKNYNNGTYDVNSYVKDSTNKGWYSNNYNVTTNGNTEANPNHETGKDLVYSSNPNVIANQQKNIYDMAGNVSEWTMETHYTDGRVLRGGEYRYDGYSDPASARLDYESNNTKYSFNFVGFRLALYLQS